MTALLGQMTDDDQVGLFHLQLKGAEFDGFNEQLKSLGLPVFDNRVVEIGGIGQQRMGRWIGGLGFAFARAEAGRNTDEAAGGYYQHLNLRLENTFSLSRPGSRWIVGPQFTALPQWSRMAFTQQESVPTLADALATPTFRLTRFNVPIELGVNALYQVPFGEGRVFVIGLSAGYRVDDEDGWRVSEATELRSPGLSVQGWFGSLRLGFQFG